MHVVFGLVKLCQTTSGSDTEEAINVTKEEKRRKKSEQTVIVSSSVTKSGCLNIVHLCYLNFGEYGRPHYYTLSY